MTRDKRIDAALREVAAKGADLSVGELASAAGLSAPRFSHLFSRTMGMLPGDFLRVLRTYHPGEIEAREALIDLLQAVASRNGNW